MSRSGKFLSKKQANWLAGDRFSADTEADFGFVGTPQIVEQVRLFSALGEDYFMIDCAGFPDLTTLELLVHAMPPVLND